MKILQWNLENLFIFLDNYQGQNLDTLSEPEWQNLTYSRYPNKPLHKVQEIAQIILKQNPEICVLSEVGGIESLNNFNQYFLNSHYQVVMTKSNSSRGIDIGFLVRKDLPYKVKIKSNRHLKLDSKFQDNSKFSRDIPQLSLFNDKDDLIMTVLGIHFKSKISLNDDYFGTETRAAEIRGLIKIYQELKKTTDSPIVVAGDFNGQLKIDSEFEPLWLDTCLIDHLDHADISVLDRTTFIRFLPEYQLIQLDYILVSKNSLSKLKKNASKVVRFQTFYDIELPLPTSFREKKVLPSDHYPQIVEFDLKS